jgi:hypothetical protein
MPDPTGPELLDALEKRLRSFRRHLERLGDWRNGCRAHNEDMGIDEPREFADDEEWDLVEGNARRALEDAGDTDEELQQLRSLLRTPEETAVLRAAIEWRFPFREKHCYTGAESRAAYVALEDAVFSLPPERRAEIMKEGKIDG